MGSIYARATHRQDVGAVSTHTHMHGQSDYAPYGQTARTHSWIVCVYVYSFFNIMSICLSDIITSASYVTWRSGVVFRRATNGMHGCNRCAVHSHDRWQCVHGRRTVEFWIARRAMFVTDCSSPHASLLYGRWCSGDCWSVKHANPAMQWLIRCVRIVNGVMYLRQQSVPPSS